MRVAFAGGEALAAGQERALRAVLAGIPAPAELHHLCRGWPDELCVRAALDVWPGVRVVAHPGPGPRVSYAGRQLSHEVRPAAAGGPRGGRVTALVGTADLVVAAPDGPEDRWADAWVAVREARRLGRALVVVADGWTITEEGPDGRKQRDPVDGLHVQPVAGLPAGE